MIRYLAEHGLRDKGCFGSVSFAAHDRRSLAEGPLQKAQNLRALGTAEGECLHKQYGLRLLDDTKPIAAEL